MAQIIDLESPNISYPQTENNKEGTPWVGIRNLQ